MATSAYVANDRTISIEPIVDFFEKVEEYINKVKKIEEQEKADNEKLQHSYQNWTHYSTYINTKYNLFFVDNHNLTYKTIAEIKNQLLYQASALSHVFADFTVSYHTLSGGNMSKEATRSEIHVNFTDHGFKVEYEVDPKETELDQLCMDFVNTINASPVKNDRLIKQKDLIIMKTGFAISNYPTAIVGVAMLFVPPIREFMSSQYWVFPVLLFAVAFLLALSIGNLKLSRSYNYLIPKKYGGYDARTNSSYRVDDMDAFNGEVDVQIGKKTDVLKERSKIHSIEKTATRIYLPGLGAILVAMLIAFLMTQVWK